MAVTQTKNPKAAKRGQYTVHPPSHAEPLDANGDQATYVRQDFPKRVYRGPKDPVTGKQAGKTVHNPFEHEQALAEGWGKAGAHNGTPIDFDADAAPDVDVTPEKPRKKPGPKPKSDAA